MKYKGFKYTKEFEFHIGKEWVGTDVEIEEGEDIDEVYRQVKSKVHQMVTGAPPESMPTRPTPQQLGPREIKVDKVPEEETTSAIINDILACTTIPKPNGIDSYYTVAQSNPRIKEAYELRKRELVAQEVAQIMQKTENQIKTTTDKQSQ